MFRLTLPKPVAFRFYGTPKGRRLVTEPKQACREAVKQRSGTSCVQTTGGDAARVMMDTVR